MEYQQHQQQQNTGSPIRGGMQYAQQQAPTQQQQRGQRRRGMRRPNYSRF